MSAPGKVRIEVGGEIDREAAEGCASKIRAAMRNGITHVELAFEQDCVIRSAEFLAFLHAVHAHVMTAGGGLVVSGASSKTLDLLRVARVVDMRESGGRGEGGST